MFNKVLVNGCSFSRGKDSWPYYIEQNLNSSVINLACAGAGNDYINQSTIKELNTRSYDLVLIMWSGLERLDFSVSDIEFFSRTPYTSKYQSKLNDWPEKIIIPVNDQDYVEKNWVFGCGYINQDKFLLKEKIFNSLYKHMSLKEHINRSLINMLCLQNFLKVQNVPYVFSFYNNYEQLLKSNSLSKYLDFNNICNNKNIHNITKENSWFDKDGIHPGPLAHREWANILTTFINTFLI